jgi:hypothetical protein
MALLRKNWVKQAGRMGGDITVESKPGEGWADYGVAQLLAAR